MREALKPRVGKPLFQEADGEIELIYTTIGYRVPSKMSNAKEEL